MSANTDAVVDMMLVEPDPPTPAAPRTLIFGIIKLYALGFITAGAAKTTIEALEPAVNGTGTLTTAQSNGLLEISALSQDKREALLEAIKILGRNRPGYPFAVQDLKDVLNGVKAQLA